MATSVTIERVIEHATIDFDRLEPAPSIRKWDEILEARAKCQVHVGDPVPGASYPILESYRGGVLYLPDGWRLVRTHPNHEGVNQWTHDPVPGETERGLMRHGQDTYEVIVKYL